MTSAYPAGENQPPVVPLRPHRGGAVLKLGIISLTTLLICFGLPSPILGFIAWWMGSNDLRKMDEGIMDPSGRGETKTGRIYGIIATIIGLILITVIIRGMIYNHYFCRGFMVVGPG